MIPSRPTQGNENGVKKVEKSLDKTFKKLILLKTSQLLALENKANQMNKKRKRGDKVSVNELIRIAISEYLDT